MPSSVQLRILLLREYFLPNKVSSNHKTEMRRISVIYEENFYKSHYTLF